MAYSVQLAEGRNMLTRDNPSSGRGQGLGSMTSYCSEIIETVKVFWGSKKTNKKKRMDFYPCMVVVFTHC